MTRRYNETKLSSSPDPVTEATHKKRNSAPCDSHATHEKLDFRIAIDFGTTFTTIAFTKGNELRSNVLTIEEFPGDRCVGRNGTQVPTEIWYLSNKKTEDSMGIIKSKAQKPIVGRDILYGYEIIRQLELPKGDHLHEMYTESGRISRPKLLLDDNAHLKDLRKDLVDALQQLKKNGLILNDEDIIRDLLVCFLTHTKSILAGDHGYSDNSKGKTF
jgi:hypothetical protein